jgi:long-subunit acyl-CoA synthetase (AMP-forming)
MTMMVLTITGRVKDQFKTDKGKYISSTIELKLAINKDIDQICCGNWNSATDSFDYLVNRIKPNPNIIMLD